MSHLEINETKNSKELRESTELSDKEAQLVNFDNATKEIRNVPKEVKEGLDKEKKTYRNPKSDLTFNLYDQNDPRRWNKRKNWGWTMNESGCLLTSAAVIHSMIDPSITPDYYRKNYAGRSPYDSIPKASHNKIQSKVILSGHTKNLKDEVVKQAQTELEKNLEKWYPVNFMVRWSNKKGWKNKHVPWQHYMTAVDIKEENGKKKVFIANTHNGKWGGRFLADEIFVSMKEASIYTPA